MLLTCLLTRVAKEKKKGKKKCVGNREKKKQTIITTTIKKGECLSDQPGPACWARSAGGVGWAQSAADAAQAGGRSGGCRHCTNLHVLFSLQRGLGLSASGSRQRSTRTPGHMGHTSMAHEACGQRRRHLTGQCHWRPLNGRWEGVSMWGSYQWRDQVRLRENLGCELRRKWLGHSHSGGG